MSVPLRAEEVTIGSGTTTNAWLPSQSYYKYSLTQQIYTAEEIGGAGTINSIAFYNGGTEKTRTYDVYLVNTEKSSFSGSSDWVSVSSNDLVFSGSVTMTANGWTTISFTSTFDYSGDNLAVVVNDKTGNYSQGMECRVFTPSGDPGVVSLYASKDGYDNYDLSNPGNASGTVTFKNQIILDIEMASVTCAKPKSFTATNIAAHTATLTWTAGAEGQSNWDVYVTTTNTNDPGDNPSPIQQVTECSKALSDLEAQTTYYAFVRSACGGDNGNSKWAKTSFRTTRIALTVDATAPYSQNFETSNDWGFENGSLTNKWCWGGATNNGGAKSMYISNNNGQSNAYSNNSTTTVYASKLFNFAQGTYTFSFDWKANGENNCDYLRVALAPGDVEFTANTNAPNIPNTWIVLDGNNKLCLKDSWQTQTSEVSVSDTYTMVFLWRNDGSVGNNPPAAIDNISISYMTCPRPTALTASNVAGRTATLSWTENGTATNWVLQYATNSSFTDLSEIAVSGTAAKDLTGLSPETKYYTRVKSVLGNEESSWSDVTDFTTTVTCPKPTNLNASNITTTSVTLSWSAGGNECGWNISICETTSMHPETDGVIYSVSENPYTIDGLAPDKMYYAYVRANCAEEGLSVWSVTKGFTTLPTCIKPTNFSASNVTSSNATLSWNAGETGQDAWNVMYKKDTDSEWTTVPVSTTTYTITGLSPVSTYYAKVQANCGEGDLSKWAETTFTTGCGAINLPYTCDFEGTSQTVNNCTIPSCWSVIRGYYNSTYRYGVPTMATPSTSTQPVVQQTHSGSYSLYFLNSTNYGTTEEYAILPEISGDYNMRDIQISFWVRSNNVDCQMEVGVMTDPSNANTYVKVAEVEVSSTYTKKIIGLSSYTGKGRYIALKCPAASMHSQAFYVDDILVEYIPSCQVPDNLAADEVGVNEVSLSWTPRGDESAWNIQYKEASDDEWSDPIAVNVTTYTLTGLQRSTLYEARVQANCDDNDQSDWTNPISFTTECGIWTIDDTHALVENFNSTAFPPTCWQKVNFGEMGVTNGWLQTFNNPLDSQGAVSSDFKNETWLFLPHMHIEGNATLSFDNLFSSGSVYAPSSIMVSTETFEDLETIKDAEFIVSEHFTSIWTADANHLPGSKQNETVSLSNYNGQDVHIAFRYEGTYAIDQIIWYIDNVHVFVPVTQNVALIQGWNWWSPMVEVSLEELETALGENGVKILSQNDGSHIYEDNEWDGALQSIAPEQMYMIQVSATCSFTLSGVSATPTGHSITIHNGFNWIGFPSSESMTLEEAFAGFEPAEGDQIISFDNSAIYEEGEWDGLLTSLYPGKGYIYISHASGDKTLIFGTGNNK